jgi:uncharacterized protein YbjT (DUF2867 family)
MKILVIGANGQIGRVLCRVASERGVEVRAMLRGADQAAALAAPHVESVIGDLETEFFPAYDGCDRVVFTAGSGGKTGGDKTLLVDLYGAIRAIEESERRGIAHFVMVSALRADDPLAAPPAMRHYMVAKKLADERLAASPLRSTILRPGRLTNEPPSGRVRTDLAQSGGASISRGNVALCVLAALDASAGGDRVVDLLDGETQISDVFR